MRLNEGWLKGPFVRSHYGRHFYRPAGEEQVEWTFPFEYKKAYFDAVLPETLALMRQIDKRKPTLMCSLHNGELGGVLLLLVPGRAWDIPGPPGNPGPLRVALGPGRARGALLERPRRHFRHDP